VIGVYHLSNNLPVSVYDGVFIYILFRHEPFERELSNFSSSPGLSFTLSFSMVRSLIGICVRRKHTIPPNKSGEGRFFHPALGKTYAAGHEFTFA
jgi:hypothetical protein